MRQIGFRLPESLAGRFRRFAADYPSQSAALRALIENALSGLPYPPPSDTPPPRSRKIAPTFSDEELRLIEAEAAALGMTPVEWVRASVQSRVSARRHLNKAERGQLRQAVQELRAMREQVFRMRRTLQRALGQTEDVEAIAAALEQLDQKLEAACDKVHQGFLGADLYWRDKPGSEPRRRRSRQPEAVSPTPSAS